MFTTIYHNPRCSKSRQTLAILEEKGMEFEIVEYLKTAPTAEELRGILDKLGKAPQDILRFGEELAGKLGLSKKDDRPEDEWISLMAGNPILIERPIVVVGDRAVLGRPPESVLEII